MANTVIQLKNSGASGNIPNALAPGELAINYADGVVFFKDSTGAIISFNLKLASSISTSDLQVSLAMEVF